MINALLLQALRERASDLHFEPYEPRSVVRFRIDGVLRDVIEPPRALHAALVSRLKIMASLDIAEKRLPQDGRIALKLGDRQVDVRVSTLPTGPGERVVLRLLDKDAARLDLDGARHERRDARRDRPPDPRAARHRARHRARPAPARRRRCTRRCRGCRAARVNIMTVEDPIEYELDGVAQTQVNPRIELDFARALRAILRQDPDVIMIGEIRDLETAQIAVQASLTGHLVLATLHTNDAASAVTRLADMGVEPYLLASSLLGVLAQRLVRTLCPACRAASRAVAGRARSSSPTSACRARSRCTTRRAAPNATTPAFADAPASTSSCSSTMRCAAASTIGADELALRARGDARRHDEPAPRRRALARRRLDVARRARARHARMNRATAAKAASRGGSSRCRVPLGGGRRARTPEAGRARSRQRARGARPAACRGLTPTAVDAAARARRRRSRRPPSGAAACADHAAARHARALRHAARPGAAAVAEQADDARAAKIVDVAAHACRGGRIAAAALARYPRTFSPLYRGLVSAGAETGRLADVLSRLADYLEAREALRQKVILALIYPALVTVIAFGVIAVLLVYVVPQVVSVYQQSRQTLPWLTQALIATQRVLPRDRLVLARGHGGGARRVRARVARPRLSRALARVAVAHCRGRAACCEASTPRASRARSRS